MNFLKVYFLVFLPIDDFLYEPLVKVSKILVKGHKIILDCPNIYNFQTGYNLAWFTLYEIYIEDTLNYEWFRYNSLLGLWLLEACAIFLI